jgi:hypothetical protein
MSEDVISNLKTLTWLRIMDIKTLLVKSITLLYRESQQIVRSENSSDMIRTVLDQITVDERRHTDDTFIYTSLRDLAMEMCRNPVDYEYDINTLLTHIKSACSMDDRLYDTFAQSLEAEYSEGHLNRSILNIRKSLNNHFKENEIQSVLDFASINFRKERYKMKDVGQFVNEVIARLEPLQMSSVTKDPAIISDIDIGNSGTMNAAFSELQDMDNGNGLMKTGWQDLNNMLQGGFRRGEFVIIPALQHKYKTGFTLSIFSQIPLYNKPYMIDPTKKPLILRISFEDKAAMNLQFLYQKLKFDETGEEVKIKAASPEEIDVMSNYIQQRLQVNGYNVKLMRVDPTLWTYKHICNKIIELEAEGYEIHLLMLDYLGMVPTTGCITSGPTGTDIRDMIRRIRNFAEPKKITIITPHQISTEAKMLIRNGLPEDKFVRDIAEKGYYAGSKQLDQEIDLEVYIHLFKHNGAWYLAVQRGKHRLPTIVQENYKYFILPFPKRMPIPDDLMKERIGMYKLPAAATNADESLFAF